MEKSTLILRLPIDLKERLDKLAKDKGISRNALILNILWEYLIKD
ncbi:ribbon-helix-helix protein, CopG family [Gemella sp. ND 6198]|nr:MULTISPECIES: ribbon-helix-helix protein, CopG family [unclassified Gemella]AXI27292.1 ribbon-helix-helix protein, CopG family [Gemella sp. ND 6198]